MQPPEDFKADDRQLEAPARLVSALKQLPQEPIFVPRSVDEAVLRAAQAKLRPRTGTQRSWLRHFGPWLAGAGATAALFLLILQTSRTSPGRVFAREDLNRDGQVDILDAFTLARRLQVNPAARGEPDFNGDGRTDHADIAWLSAAAVRLGKGGPS